MGSRRVPLLLLLFWLVATMGWWAFAFAPVTSKSPEWFTAARNACFGTLESGLPDTYGWMILILGPGSLLLGLLVAWYDELKSGLRATLLSSRGRAYLVIVCAFIAAETNMVWGSVKAGLEVSRMSFQSGEFGDLPLDYPRTEIIPHDFKLVNQLGQRIRLSELKGKIVLLTFAFAHCQTVCPTLVQQAIQGIEGLDQSRFQLLIVTLDPWRDTPRSLPQLAAKWKLPENAWVLSGNPVEVEETIRAFKIPHERNAQSGDISHPALTFLLDASGKVAYTFNNSPSHWLRAASERLAGNVAEN